MDIHRIVEIGHDLHTLPGPADTLLHLFLLMSIKDQASELHLGKTNEDQFEVWYKGGGQYWEMVPPPAHLATEMFRVLRIMGGFPETKTGEQSQLLLGFRVRGPEVRALGVMGWNWYGPCASFYLWPSRAASAAAQLTLSRTISRVNDNTLLEFPVEEPD